MPDPLLEAETILACRAVGLDPAVGILYADRRERASLVFDLIDECRTSRQRRGSRRMVQARADRRERT